MDRLKRWCAKTVWVLRCEGSKGGERDRELTSGTDLCTFRAPDGPGRIVIFMLGSDLCCEQLERLKSVNDEKEPEVAGRRGYTSGPPMPMPTVTSWKMLNRMWT